MEVTHVKLPKYQYLETHEKLTFLGSCFSEHMAKSAHELAFDTLSNPYGVIFNPISLANIICWKEKDWINSIFQSQDKYLSWNSSSTIWSLDKEKLIDEVLQLSVDLRNHLCKTNTLFVTFGTAWIYETLEDRRVVANCHKQPQNNFTKRCLSAQEIMVLWKEALSFLKEINPQLKVVFTVSPVRHKKDGLIENNLSKGRLISAVHEIVSNHDKVYYFPSYEIVIDELRDYSYFERDGVHPNRYAIEEIEERFLSCFLSETALKTIHSFKSIRSLMEHRILHEGSAESEKLIKDRKKKRDTFLHDNPGFESLLK